MPPPQDLGKDGLEVGRHSHCNREFSLTAAEHTASYYPEAIERKDMNKRIQEAIEAYAIPLTWLVLLFFAGRSAFADGDGSFSGVSYSFNQSHPDFGVPSCVLSYGNVAGLFQGRPTYSGGGHELVTPWTQDVDGGGMPLAPSLYGTADEACQPVVETTGTAGDPDSGSIFSAATFAQWFRPTLGINQTWPITLTDEDTEDGQWAIERPNFKPTDVRGNLYTVSLAADFVYQACTSQEFELSYRGDAWVFIGPTLVIDLGGTNHQGAWQSIDLDRLGLSDGETYRLRIFLAHRTNGAPADLTIRAESMALAPVREITIGGVFD